MFDRINASDPFRVPIRGDFRTYGVARAPHAQLPVSVIFFKKNCLYQALCDPTAQGSLQRPQQLQRISVNQRQCLTACRCQRHRANKKNILVIVGNALLRVTDHRWVPMWCHYRRGFCGIQSGRNNKSAKKIVIWTRIYSGLKIILPIMIGRTRAYRVGLVPEKYC
jgi:hypothetical protein